MSRRIITSQVQSGAFGATQPSVDNFMEKLWKYIPAEVVAFYVFASGLLGGATLDNKQVIYWIVVLLGLIAAFFWTLRQTQTPGLKPAYLQAGVSTVAFLIWVFALGGPFTAFAWYNSIIGAILLAAFTLFSPLINPN